MAIKHAPNREAYLLLTGLIERLGLTRRGFLDRLADLRYAYLEDSKFALLKHHFLA